LSCPDCCDKRFGAEDGDKALDIIGKNAEAHLCGDVFDNFGEEVTRAHPAFEGSKDMLDGLHADGHGVGPVIETRKHVIDHAFMLPAFDVPVFAGGAAGSDFTVGTSR